MIIIKLSRDKMKVVVCQNCGCGEKYQLDDEDDINAFECSVCSGNLEELDGFSNDEEKVSSDYDSQNNSGLVLVYCTSCGLKYQLSESDNINEFECNSCGGSLDYISNMVSASTETTDSTNFTQNPLTETPLADDEIDEIHSQKPHSLMMKSMRLFLFMQRLIL